MVRFLTSGRTVPAWFLLAVMVVVAALSAGIVYRTYERDAARKQLYRELVIGEVTGGENADERARELGLLRFTFSN